MIDGLVAFRDLEPDDLGDLDWSGGDAHLRHVAGALGRAYAGDVVLLVGILPNARLVAMGGVDLAKHAGVGVLWMLAVHEALQSLGIGTALIGALERRARDAGCATGRISVEHDNPRALALYRRLGYAAVGTEVESWSVTGNRTYVTVSTVLERAL